MSGAGAQISANKSGELKNSGDIDEKLPLKIRRLECHLDGKCQIEELQKENKNAKLRGEDIEELKLEFNELNEVKYF